MTAGLAWLAAIMAVQGQALELAIADAPGLTAVEAEWQGRRVPFAAVAGVWRALIGVDLEAPPGRHLATIALRFSDGSRREYTDEVVVADTAFPTTELTVEPRYVELSPADAARVARETAEIDAIYVAVTPERLWSQPFEAPLPGARGGRNFGHRRVFNGQPRDPHSGTDLTAATGTPIRATNRGRVVLAKELFFSGNAVFVDHGMGVYSVYLHLSAIHVTVGETVERGAVVGLAGATGRVTGPHLHWGARVLAARVDPFTLLGLAGESR